MPSKRLKQFAINDLDKLQKEFYISYNPDYWKYKISLLKNSHDFFDNIKENLTDDLEEFDEEYYKRMIRTELHFLYFQMTETLFETIFAVTEHDNRDLWLALTFSNDHKTVYYSDCYNKINKFSEGNLEKPDLWSKIKVKINNESVEISLLRWIFYFHYSSKMSDEEWKTNLDKIYSLLKRFAKDFSDRGEYNAYKHSLRFYNSPSHFAIVPEGSTNPAIARKSKDSIIYVEESDDNGKRELKQILNTSKPFDFYRDYVCCLIVHRLLNNIINTRKYSFLEGLHGKKFNFTTFLDVKIPHDITPKTGYTKMSFTI